MAGKFSIYKYCRTDAGWRYCKTVFHPNGKIKSNIVLVRGKEEKHAEGSYFLNHNNLSLPKSPFLLKRLSLHSRGV